MMNLNKNTKYQGGNLFLTNPNQNIENMKQAVYWYSANTLGIAIDEVNKSIQQNIKQEIGKKLNTVV